MTSSSENSKSTVPSEARSGSQSLSKTSRANIQVQPQELLSQDVSIANARIVRLLDDTIKKLEVGLNLSIFLKNDCMLIAPHLTRDELDIMMKFSTSSEVSSLRSVYGLTSAEQLSLRNAVKDNVSRMTGQSEGGTEHSDLLDRRIDPDVARMIDVFFTKPRLQQLVDFSKHSVAAILFLDHCRLFRNLIAMRLNISTVTEQERNTKLRSVWWQNEKAKEKIQKLAEKLAEQKELAEAALMAQNQTIHSQNMKITKMLLESKEAIKSNVTDAQRTMVVACKAAEARHETLSQELKDAQNLLTNELSEHLASEKQLRARRYKIESQLISWIDKYDLDMGEKQAELEDLQAGFDEEKRQLQQLQEDFEIQEVEYNELMEEKEAIYIAERNEKMYIFIMNRSARRIQRWWRAYLARKLARKLARRAKRLKRAAAAAARKNKGRK